MITKEQYLISSTGLRPEVSILLSRKNKSDFIRAAYIYIADYFCESLKKLHMEIPQAEICFRTLDESRFMASVSLNGSIVSSCRVWFGGNNRIAYFAGSTFSVDCLCDFLTAEEENGRLFLKSLPDIDNEYKLTIKLSAGYLWKKFTLALKNNSN